MSVRRNAMPGMGLREAHGLLGSFQNIFKKCHHHLTPRLLLSGTAGAKKKLGGVRAVRALPPGPCRTSFFCARRGIAGRAMVICIELMAKAVLE